MAEAPDELSPGPLGPGDSAGLDEEALSARRIEQALSLSSLWAHVALLAVVTVGTVMMLVDLSNYSERARQFPFLTLVATLVMVAIRLVQVIVVARRDGEPPRDRSRLRREAVMLSWVVGMGVAVVLFGLIPGAMLFLVAYLAVHRPAGLLTSVIVLVGLWAAVYVLFVQVLNLPLRPGVLF